ncbi:hypothetical protein O1611_g403 [Lasiodiplodia mahajangana]|uniref:Uncharacterized protein n=1 Tax=Lasiodiplodia mahajangana TaxID=1108764 RepID=A0ACC2K092_9PEZI|nr:hypothetical protein O1611_g403 [Lasiodiplodia mahajangana]
MVEQWDLDSPTAEEEEAVLEGEKNEASLKRKCFNWLSHDNRGAAYISYNQFSHLPATSFEFGADGFAGACNNGGELLHFSAPSKEHGLIFARGAFSSSLYACISRAQMEYGGSATFGLRIARDQMPYNKKSSKGSSFRLGEMTERGCFNYRWPLNEYSLFSNNLPGEKDGPDIEAGTCTRLSYFKNGVCYQVIRLEERSKRDIDQEGIYYLAPWDGQVVLEIGGSIYFQLLEKVTATSYESSSSAHIEDRSSTQCLRIVDVNLNIGIEARVYQLNADGNGVTALNLNPSLANQATCENSQPSSSGFNSSKSTLNTHEHSVSTSANEETIDRAPMNLIYEANAKLHPPSKERGYRRSETFIAAIRLIQSVDTRTPGDDPKVPSSEDMHEDIWVEPVRPGRVLESNSQATGIMWETILQWRDLHTDPMSEFTEISLMARSLEKILQVDLVPAFYGTENRASAVISNPFMHPTVSLRSLFWKVRFLVKIHHFLSGLENNYSTRGTPQLSNDKDEKRLNRQEEKADIEILSPSEINAQEGSSTPLQPQCSSDQSDFYYITMTIWYIVKSFRKKTVWESSRRLRDFRQENMTNSCIPPDNHNFGVVDKRKISLLKWYHYGSLLSLADRGILPSYWRSTPMKRRVYSLSNAATMACTGSTASNSHYSVDDEIVDRLSFLARELGMEEFDATAETVTSASIQRVRGREFTIYLNPGVSYPNWRGRNFQETFGPWEIHALCHNSRIQVLTLESESEYVKASRGFRGETREEEVAMYKNKVYRFLNSEVTLIPCWERSPTKMRSGWLQSEAAAVHGSTLLDIHSKIPVISKVSPKSSPQTGPISNPAAGQYRGPESSLITGSPDGFDTIAFATQFQDILKEFKGPEVRPIDWVSFRPPRQYYPDNFINSLEDTPHLFRPPATDNVFIPATLNRIAKRPDPESIGFGYRDLVEALEKASWLLSILDILVFQQSPSSRRRELSRGNNIKLPNMRYFCRGAKTASGRRALIDTFKKENELVRALFDSLVDQSVQHRILHIRKLPNELIRMLAFVVHPEAVICLSNHVLHTPRFSFHKGPTWIANITVGSWILTDITERVPRVDDSVTANEPVKFPLELKDAARGSSTLISPQHCVSFFVSSAVLSTNAFGDFSRCTIISKASNNEFDNKKAKLEQKEVEVAEISNEIWQIFVHQPQTARCLVFLHVLGMLCIKLRQQYHDTIKEFESIAPSTNVFLVEETEWNQDKLSLPKLQLILWCLDCLYKFQNSLKTSIANIIDAKTELLSQIQEQAANRTHSLQALCQKYIANFESDVVELTQVNEYLESNIASAMRFKDALSGTLALRDSRVGLTQNATSLEQNNAIQALTYLTIGYLPLGLITAVFAIPSEQNVVIQGMGKGWFVGSILIMSAVTYLVVAFLNPLAAWLSSIADFIKPPSALENDRRDHRPNLWRALRNIREYFRSHDKSFC